MPRHSLSLASRCLWLCLLALFSLPILAQDDETFMALLRDLDVRDFDVKARAIDALVESDHPRVRFALETLLAGDLYLWEDEDRIVTGERVRRDILLRDVLSGEDLATVGRRDADKISVNNQLRTLLRSVLARLDLTDPNPAVRLAAVQQLIDDFDADRAALLQEAMAGEEDPRVRETMAVALAIGGLNAEDPAERLAAAESLAGNLNPEVRGQLNNLISTEQDLAVRAAAQASVAAIQETLEFYQSIEMVFFGLSLGSVLFLAAIGLAITFGVMGVINMAHGELIMLGAYTTYVVQLLMPNAIDWSLLVAIPAAFLVAGLAGVIIERGVIQFLYGRPLETLLATFGISLILQQLVRNIFTAQNRPVSNPDWMSGTWQVNAALSLTWNRVYILVFALIVFAVLLLVLKRTSLGLKVRAVAQNRGMAKGLGVRTEWVDAMTFGLGAGIAGVAGVALSQLTNVGPNLGQAYIIDSFLVVVFGGVGNLWGTLVGALGLGVANKFLEPTTGAVLSKILVLVFIILFIQKRPNGLFPQRGRAAEA